MEQWVLLSTQDYGGQEEQPQVTCAFGHAHFWVRWGQDVLSISQGSLEAFLVNKEKKVPAKSHIVDKCTGKMTQQTLKDCKAANPALQTPADNTGSMEAMRQALRGCKWLTDVSTLRKSPTLQGHIRDSALKPPSKRPSSRQEQHPEPSVTIRTNDRKKARSGDAAVSCSMNEHDKDGDTTDEEDEEHAAPAGQAGSSKAVATRKAAATSTTNRLKLKKQVAPTGTIPIKPAATARLPPKVPSQAQQQQLQQQPRVDPAVPQEAGGLVARMKQQADDLRTLQGQVQTMHGLVATMVQRQSALENQAQAHQAPLAPLAPLAQLPQQAQLVLLQLQALYQARNA